MNTPTQAPDAPHVELPGGMVAARLGERDLVNYGFNGWSAEAVVAERAGFAVYHFSGLIRRPSFRRLAWSADLALAVEFLDR